MQVVFGRVGLLPWNKHRAFATLTWPRRQRRLVSAIAMVALSIAFAQPALATIAYVQGAGLNPNSGSSVSVTFTAAQTAGNFNVVSVAWDDTTSTVTSITDTKGSTYVLAGTPGTISGTVTQQFYYATNIAAAAAGANTVTVTYSKSVTYPEVKIAEYSGIATTSPFDGMVSTSGTGTAILSGSLTTTNASDLLIASDVIFGTSTVGDPNYTSRDTVGGDLEQDRIVSAVGSYTASDTQTPSSWWLIQLIAFKAAAGTPPTAPTGLTATAYSASEIILNWGASTDAAGVTNYLVERCSGANCTSFSQIGASTSTGYSDSTVSIGTTYSYRVRATDAAALLSGYSNSSVPTSPALRPGGINYTYDAGGRLTVVANGNDSTTTYTLDAAGNRTQTSVSTPSAFSAPSGLTVTPVSATSLKLTWNPPTGGYGTLTYQIYRAGSQVGTSATASYTDTGLAAHTSPSYTIGATDAHGDPSPISPPGSNYTYALPTITTFSGASASSTSINLTWADPDTNGPGLSGYTLYRGTTLLPPLAAGTTSYVDTGLGIGTSYTYTLTAQDTAGDTASASATAPTFPALNLTSFTATPTSSTTMTLAWTANDATGQGALKYSLARGATVLANPATSPVSDTGLAIATSYTYTLTATDTVGDTVNVTTPGKTYPLPTASLSVGPATATSVTLNYTAADANGPGLKNIAIYKGGVLQTQATSASGSYVPTGLSPGTSYTYSMYSYDTDNDTSLVSTVTASTAGHNDAGTMTEGGISSGPINIIGFFHGTINYGSYTPTALTGGKTLIDFVDADSNGTVEVSGFTSDPGAGWLLSATGRGVTKQASAAVYSYSAGTATWEWTNSVFGFQTSGTTSCIITHL